MNRDPLGPNGDAARALADVFVGFTDEQWRELAAAADAARSRKSWRAVTRAIADSRMGPTIANALDTAGIKAASRAIRLPRDFLGGRWTQVAATEFPGAAMYAVVIRHKTPRWVTELALAPLVEIGVDVEPFLPPASPDDEPMPAEYQN